MAAPTIRTVGTAIFGTAGTLVPVVPTDADGDVLLCFVGSAANASVTPTHSMTNGWALIQSGVIASGTIRSRTSVYWKRTNGSEGNPTVTVTPTGATACHHSAVILAVQDIVAAGDPYEGASNNSAAGAAAVALTLTTSTDETLGFLAAMHADNVATGVTNNGSFTQRIATDDATGIDGFLWVGSKTIATAGSGQGGTVTFTSGGTGAGISGVAFAILPGVAAITGTGAATLPAIVGDGAGTPVGTGTGAATLGLASSASGSPVATGSGAASIGLSTAASGSPVATGTAAATLPAIIGDGEGEQLGGVTGEGAATLVMAGSGQGSPVATGAGAAVLPALVGSGAGAQPATGSGAATIGLTTSAEGSPVISGTGAAMVPPIEIGLWMGTTGNAPVAAPDPVIQVQLSQAREEARTWFLRATKRGTRR